MKTCMKCNEDILPSVVINGKKHRSFWNRSYCYTCSPWGARNNQKLELKRTDGAKTCAGPCGADLPVTAFSKRDGVCKTCIAAKAKKRRHEVKRQCVDYLGGACSSCGYNRCIAALDFHHKNPSEKDFEIGRRKTAGLEQLKKELDKCVLLCRNCHAEHHFSSSK